MAVHRIRLDAQRHAEFLAEQRKDPITKEPISADTEVVICTDQRIAFIAENWPGRCPICECTDTLANVPTSSFPSRLGRPQVPRWRKRVAVLAVIGVIAALGYWNRALDPPAEQVSSSAPPASCFPVTLTATSLVDGRLEDNDCGAPHRMGKKADLYTFEGTAGQQVTLTMTSSVLDSYLIMLGPDGSVVDTNDDVSSTDKSSRIRTHLPTSGTYTIEASGASEDDRGVYSLSLRIREGAADEESLESEIKEIERLLDDGGYKRALDRAGNLDQSNEKVRELISRIETAWEAEKRRND